MKVRLLVLSLLSISAFTASAGDMIDGQYDINLVQPIHLEKGQTVISRKNKSIRCKVQFDASLAADEEVEIEGSRTVDAIAEFKQLEARISNCHRHGGNCFSSGLVEVNTTKIELESSAIKSIYCTNDVYKSCGTFGYGGRKIGCDSALPDTKATNELVKMLFPEFKITKKEIKKVSF
jgi:hypothetical protein